MRHSSYSLDRPRIQDFEASLEPIIAARDDLGFVVLFGSMGRGNWSLWGGYDVLNGLSQDDGQLLIDGMTEFDRNLAWNIEFFPYARGECERMIGQYHPLFLGGLDYGIVLYDRDALRRHARHSRAGNGTES